MLRKRGIQTQLVLTIGIMLAALTLAVQAIQIVYQHNDQIDATRQQSLKLADSMSEANATLPAVLKQLAAQPGFDSSQFARLMSSQLDESFANLATTPNVSFVALVMPDNSIAVHSDPAYKGQQISDIGLDKLPLNQTVRRKLPGYGSTYLTRTRIQSLDLTTGAVARLDLIVGMAAHPVDQALNNAVIRATLIELGIILFILLAIAYLLRRNVAHPLHEVNRAAQSFTAGHLDHRIEPQGSAEFRDLVAALNQMADVLQRSRQEQEESAHTMELRVQERTRDLQMSYEIGRVATRMHDVGVLLHETVEQIRRRFDVIYHAQVFLTDELSQYAVLVESTGEAGQALLQLGHKLAVGSHSLIGRVTSRGQTVIASDTLKGEVPWQPNPLLPGTRAEMALPLLIEGRVIGALDVQSTQPDVFTPEMVQVFQVLADQLAIAIENARLLAESERRVHEIDDLNRQLTQKAWQDFVEVESAHQPRGYVYNQMEVVPLDGEKTSELPSNRVESAIQVRGEMIGTLAAAMSGREVLSSDDRALMDAVAQRVALAVENARLFQQTQRALAETEQLYDTARAVSSTSELATIYQLVVEQLSAVPTVDSIEILLSGPDPSLVQYLETTHTWKRGEDISPLMTRERVRILPQYESEEDQIAAFSAPMIYPRLAQDMPQSHPLYAKLIKQNIGSALVAPLNAGGRWFGLLVCSSRHPGAFEPAYVTFAGALADQLAIAIENRRLFEEAQAEARRARALSEAGQLANQIGGDYETGLQNLFQAVAGPGNYDRWWFGLLTPDSRTLERTTASERNLLVETVDVDHDQNALAEAARIGEIVLVNDPTDHPVVGQQDPASLHRWGKHIAAPVRIGQTLVGVLQIGRSLDDSNLDERDIQLAATLASQVAVATENRRLFAQAESQRQSLQSILDTMPVGVLVIDAQYNVVLSNQGLKNLLGSEIRMEAQSRPQYFVRTNSEEPYPLEEWPLTKALHVGISAMVEDVTIRQPDGFEIDLLASAAPVFNPDGSVAAAVGVFQDITEMRELELALQNSLLETTALYEASRQISRATDLEDIFQVMLRQIITIEPDQAYLFFQEGSSEALPTLAAAHPVDAPLSNDLPILASFFSGEQQVIQASTLPPDVEMRLRQANLATLIVFPLSVRDTVIGWLAIGFQDARDWSDEDARFLSMLADQAAIAIENQRLFIRTRQALQSTSTLYHASREITDAESPSDVLMAFVNYALPKEANYAVLYLLLGGDVWDTPYAAVEVAAVWGDNRTESMTGMRFNSAQFPYWQEMVSAQLSLFSDIERAPDLSEQARAALQVAGIRSAAIIPLSVSGRPTGALLIGIPQPYTHTEDEARIYRSLADQAAVSLENNRLNRQTQRRARLLATSAEISRAVTSILRLDELFPRVVDLIRESFGYDHAQIFMIGEDGQNANLIASTGEAGQKLLAKKHSLPVGSHSVIGQVTETGQPQIALDTADARVIHRPNPLLPNTRSEMALPLIARDKILGALDVQSNQPGAFVEEDARALASLADLVATAIDNARLFELSQKHAEETSFLFDVTTAAATSSDLEQALQHAVETVSFTLKQVSSAGIFLPDETGGFMIPGAEIGERGAQRRSSIPIDQGLVGWVARNQEAVIVDDVSKDPRYLAAVASSQSAMGIPLIAAGGLVGVLMVESKQSNAFSEDDLRLMQTLSGTLAAIIQNSRLLREVQLANERLLEVDRLKTNFLAAMSHELRTPLNSIIGFSRVILKGIDGPLTETQEQDLTTIFDSGKHLLGLVNDILDQAKIEAGKMELSFGYFKVQDVIRGVMSTAVGLTRDKPIRLYTEIEEDLPNAYGDEFRTRQILLNLISNASKFTHQGSITASAVKIEEDEQTYIKVSVADTGIGVAEKDIPLMFEPFQQVDNSTTRAAEGTGMGLPLSKSLTELQGGRIWVDSKVGEGSTFYVTIPTAPSPEKMEEPEEEQAEALVEQLAEQPQSEQVPPSSRIVLVIEDDIEVINLYRRYLSREGYEVTGTTHPEEAVELVIAYRPCVVLLDVNMPDQNGWDVLENLKRSEEAFYTPVIVCSINPDVERGYRLGAADYLLKPFTEDQLLDSVHQVQAERDRPHILIVDDHPESVRVFREALEASEYTVIEATDGHQALDVIQRGPQIDLVILDLRMPELDGFGVLQALRSSDRTTQVPILVLTAEDVSAQERALLSAVDVYRKDELDEQGLLLQVESQLKSVREGK